MFAVIKTGGKQYRVAAGDEFTVEKLAAEPGETVQFNEVLMLGREGDVSVGTPLISDAGVQAEVVAQGKGEKVYNFKKRRRKHSSKRLKGHRQALTTIRILEILEKGAEASGVKAAIGTGSLPKDERPVSSEDQPAAAANVADAPEAEETQVAEAPEAPEAADPAPEAEADAGTAEAVEPVKPGNLLDEAEGEPDDLTKISGVGPKLMTKLNENGVFHFRQIAAWGPAEIAWMDDQLSFKGRIERDNWIEQATGFADEAK